MIPLGFQPLEIAPPSPEVVSATPSTTPQPEAVFERISGYPVVSTRWRNHELVRPVIGCVCPLGSEERREHS